MLWSLIVGGGMPLPACAGKATQKVLGLTDAERIAFERNWGLQAAKANVDQATA